MVYLDYSATTPTSKEVLDSFVKTSIEYPGNPNSLHKLGVDASKLITSATKQIANILNINENEIIYTSGASESNNTALKGICSKYKNRGKHIITSNFEHSSIYGPLNYLTDEGFEVDFVNSKEDGTIDLDHLKSLMRDDTILVSINAINSEIGIIQPIKEIAKIVKSYSKCYFHTDITQAVSKIKIDLTDVDLASFSAHKFFGIKGIGVLYKKEKLVIEPLIHGGKSTTIYRSGTPQLPLIVATSKALRLASLDMDKKYDYVKKLNNMVRDGLKDCEGVYINSTDKCLPHILNLSVVGIKPETMLHALEKEEVYISTQTACSSEKAVSKSVLALTKDEKRASSSIRVSISYKTTEDEIKYFLKAFDKCLNELRLK